MKTEIDPALTDVVAALMAQDCPGWVESLHPLTASLIGAGIALLAVVIVGGVVALIRRT